LTDIGSGESAAFKVFVPYGAGLGQTNIFTAWRYLVEDFGFAGAPLAAFVMGLVAAAAWKRVAERPTPVALAVLLCAYAYILNSTTQTVFLFTNIMLAFAVTGLALSLRPAAPKPTSLERRAASIRGPSTGFPGDRGARHVGLRATP
jgi:hypothetical protein